MEGLIKSVSIARDYIDGLDFETVRNVIESKDKVVFENGIVNDFYNTCRNIRYWDFTRENFRYMKTFWMMSLTSVILEYMDINLNGMEDK